MTARRLRFEGFDPDDEGHREALCALGNGTRGAAPSPPMAVQDGVQRRETSRSTT